jgi:hypothetical protein
MWSIYGASMEEVRYAAGKKIVNIQELKNLAI